MKKPAPGRKASTKKTAKSKTTKAKAKSVSAKKGSAKTPAKKSTAKKSTAKSKVKPAPPKPARVSKPKAEPEPVSLIQESNDDYEKGPTEKRPFALRNAKGDFIHAVADITIALDLAKALNGRVKVWKWRGPGKKEILMAYVGEGWKRSSEEEAPTTPEVVALMNRAPKKFDGKPWMRVPKKEDLVN